MASSSNQQHQTTVMDALNELLATQKPGGAGLSNETIHNFLANNVGTLVEKGKITQEQAIQVLYILGSCRVTIFTKSAH